MTTDLDALHREMTAWRRDLHAHPEFGFEEKRTSAFVAAKLREFGLDDVAEGGSRSWAALETFWHPPGARTSRSS